MPIQRGTDNVEGTNECKGCFKRGLAGEVEQLIDEIEELKNENEQLRDEIEELKNEIKELKEMNE